MRQIQERENSKVELLALLDPLKQAFYMALSLHFHFFKQPPKPAMTTDGLDKSQGAEVPEKETLQQKICFL